MFFCILKWKEASLCFLFPANSFCCLLSSLRFLSRAVVQMVLCRSLPRSRFINACVPIVSGDIQNNFVARGIFPLGRQHRAFILLLSFVHVSMFIHWESQKMAISRSFTCRCSSNDFFPPSQDAGRAEDVYSRLVWSCLKGAVTLQAAGCNKGTGTAVRLAQSFSKNSVVGAVGEAWILIRGTQKAAAGLGSWYPELFYKVTPCLRLFDPLYHWCTKAVAANLSSRCKRWAAFDRRRWAAVRVAIWLCHKGKAISHWVQVGEIWGVIFISVGIWKYVLSITSKCFSSPQYCGIADRLTTDGGRTNT